MDRLENKVKMHALRLVVLLPLGAAPVTVGAETLTWGQIDLRAGALRFDNLSGEALNIVDRRPESYRVAGRIGADWGSLGAQLDLAYGAFVNGSELGHHHDWDRMAAVRLTYDVGPAIGLGAVYGAGNSQPVADPGSSFDFQAVEGAYATGNWQFGLQLGRFDAVDTVGTNAFHDGTFARLGTIYSLASGGVVSADLGLFDGKQDAASEFNMKGVTLSVEYARQIGEKPLAWSAGVSHGQFEKDGIEASSLTETRATIGLTAWFGDGDLPSAKRRAIFSQPDFGYIVDTGNLID